MKYLVSCLLSIPALISCTTVQYDYYQQQRYAPAPQVEVQRYRPQGYSHSQQGYRPNRRGRVHGHSGIGNNAVVANSRAANNHSHLQPNVSSHPSKPSIHPHPGSLDNMNNHEHGHL